MAKGLDSPSALPVSALLGGGYDFVGRYISGYAPKSILLPELQGYIAAGLKTILVYEDEAADALGGASVGRAKAAIAAPLLDALGWPKSRPVHFATDCSPVGSQVQAAVECAQAFAAALGRPAAVYGDVNVCTAAYNVGIKYLWQFGDGTAPGRSIFQVYPWIYLAGLTADPDITYVSDYGQWPFHKEVGNLFATNKAGTLYRLSQYAVPGAVGATEEWRVLPSGVKAQLAAAGIPVVDDSAGILIPLWEIHTP